MKRIFLACLAAGVAQTAFTAKAEPAPSAPSPGATYQITFIRDATSHSDTTASGSSHDQDTLIERLVSIGPEGWEVVFDLPEGASPDDRRRAWEFPARVLKQPDGRFQLVNAADLERRLDDWLAWGQMTREACGHWIFTWNAFKIECDPQSVIATVRKFDPVLPQIRNGALYHDGQALMPAVLKTQTTDAEGSTLTARLDLDPTSVQRDRAEADVVTGEILRKPVTLEAALAERAKETITGTIDVAIAVDPDGDWRRLTRVIAWRTEGADGKLQTDTVTETLERRLMASGNP